MKILEKMQPLKISLPVAQKFINSDKIDDFKVQYTKKNECKPVELSKDEFLQENLSLSYFLILNNANSCKNDNKVLTFKVIINSIE